MPEAIKEIINLIDMRTKIHTELLEKTYLKNKRLRKAKIEELQYLKEIILLAYEEGGE